MVKFNFAEVRSTQDFNIVFQRLSTNKIWSLKELCLNYDIFQGIPLGQPRVKNINNSDLISTVRSVTTDVDHT